MQNIDLAMECRSLRGGGSVRSGSILHAIHSARYKGEIYQISL